MTLMTANCFAGDDMADRASQLMSALNFPTNTGALVASQPIFSGKDTVKAGDFQLKQKKMMVVESGAITDVEMLDKDGIVTAAGQVIESVSSSGAQKALAVRLVMNSMPMEMLIQTYELRRDEIGDFCILNKILNKTTGEYVVSPAVIHFVRGGKAVSLYAVGKDKDVRVTAKALDAMLSEMSGVEKPANWKSESGVVP